MQVPPLPQSGDVAPRWPAAPGSWLCRACRRGRSRKTLTSGFRPSTARGEPCALLGTPPPCPRGSQRPWPQETTLPAGKGEEGPARRGGQLLPRACKIHDKDNISIGNMSPAVSDLRPPAHPPPTPTACLRGHGTAHGCLRGPGWTRTRVGEVETPDFAWPPPGLPHLELVLGKSVDALSRSWLVTQGVGEAGLKRPDQVQNQN